MNKKLLSLVTLATVALRVHAMEPEQEAPADSDSDAGFVQLATSRTLSTAPVPASTTPGQATPTDATTIDPQALALLRRYESPMALNGVEIHGIKVSPIRVNAHGHTLLTSAVFEGHASIAEAIFAKGLATPTDDHVKEAAERAYTKLGHVLFKYCPNLFNLAHAVALDAQDIAIHCLKAGSQPNALCKLGFLEIRPLALAKSIAMAQLLIENGANFNTTATAATESVWEYSPYNRQLERSVHAHTILFNIERAGRKDVAQYLKGLGATLSSFDKTKS